MSDVDDDPGPTEAIYVLVGVHRSLMNLLTARIAQPVSLYCLYAVKGFAGLGLELDDVQGSRTIEAYADIASVIEDLSILVLPGCHLPDRVDETLRLLSELGASVIRPACGADGWPDPSAGQVDDGAIVDSVCRELHLPQTEVAPSAGRQSLVERERATLLSILRGLASHDKLGPNNHSSEDDLWKSRGQHLKKGQKKGLLNHLTKAKGIIGSKRNQSMGGTGRVYWICSVAAALAEFPELAPILAPPGGLATKGEADGGVGDDGAES